MRGRGPERLAALLAALMLTTVASTPGAAATPEIRKVTATPVQMLDLAEQLARRGSLADAETVLSLLSRDPNSDIRNEARFRLAQLLQSQRKPTRAAELLRQVL